ncbi:iron complex outermembrane recepter protein [Mucilaginibacter mallensis]|uniref:Iron complex outermembrane recepter protein n=1 Tax=Mucilaginibacter mallensis TaxID=652787 RepID=A0A1H1THF8_MUCMA|nr:SusC/RagA family TonB-linked outer membrane protein [Mucilaginibacter mallensis]SDS59648.1 iron complex outermembrane recepter protein [Mucilaginibacter mallensis]
MKKIYFLRYSFLLLFICLSNWVMAQSSTITGRIIDEDNQPLPGATVIIKGTSISAGTDVNGYFKLTNAPGGQQTLVVRYVGYESLEKPITTANGLVVNLQLKSSSVLLNQVAVIGYGTIKKADATGSVDVVTAKDFNKGAVNSIQDAVSGKLPGVVITSNSGAPGNTSTIRIRGTTSINASSDPLIVIDGVPLSNVVAGGTANILTSINPNDVENITVLKDASATAIYGSRGSSGVILITTKRGTKDFSINYNGTFSLSVIPKEVPVYTASQFRDLINTPSTFSTPGAQAAAQALLGTANTNWQNQIYQKAFGDDHNLSISGSTKNMPYRVSVGYDDADGVLKTYNFQRTTVAVGLDPSFFNHTLNLHINLKGLYNTNNFADQAAIGSAVNYDPTQSVYNGNTRWRGYTTWTTNGNTNINGAPVTLATANPVARLNETDNTSTNRRSIGNIQADYKIPGIDGLRANVNLGYDYADAFGKNNVLDSTQWIYLPVASGGQKISYNTVNRNQLAEFYLNYKKDLKSIKSVIDVTGGYSFSHFYTEGNTMSSDYNETTFNPSSPYKTEYYLASFFGRLNYTFDSKYILTFTIRDDGTSKFAPANRWGVFPAGAFAWRIKDEDFMKDNTLFSDLKLRLGYGTTGQQDLTNNNNYPYLPQYTISDNASRYQFGNTFYNTLRPGPYDAGIKWESTTTSNIGLDFGFLNGRLTGSIDAYYKKTKNLLNVVNVPVLTNFAATLLENVGSMQNKGAELSLNAVIIDQKDWHWQMGYNVSFNKNKILNLVGSTNPGFVQVNPNSGISGTTSGTIQANEVGYPINSFYVYQQIYDKNGKPIEDGYVDRNGDGQINSSDLYLDHSPNPTVLMGINSDLAYKRFDFSFSGRVSLGNYDYNNVAAGSTYRGLYSSLGYLSNQTTNASVTQFTTALTTNQSDYYIQNASFFKMDNMNLGYTFPTYIKNKLKLRVSAGVQNVFTITPYKGLDPEIQGGLDNNFFPRARIYQLGVNASF